MSVLKNMLTQRRCALLVVFLLAVLGGSVALNLLLFDRGRQYYVQLNETRLDPLGLRYFSMDNEPRGEAGTEQMRVVFFGDSRAADWPAPAVEGFEFINRGMGAETSVQAEQRFDHHVKPLQPDVVVIQVGINDLKTIPLFPGRREAIVGGCRENIRRIVEKVTGEGARVILTTILPVGGVPLERRPYWSDEVALAVDEVNEYLEGLASERVLVFDAFSVLAGEGGGLRKQYEEDELHLNAAGYEALNREFEGLLGSLSR